MLAVVDTNVFVSGLLGSRSCRNIFISFRKNRFKLAISPLLFEELVEVIERPKFQALFDRKEIVDLIHFTKYKAVWTIPHRRIHLCRDSKDNHILECAHAAKVDIIVSGDQDLLSLNSFETIPILNPSHFINRLKEK